MQSLRRIQGNLEHLGNILFLERILLICVKDTPKTLPRLQRGARILHNIKITCNAKSSSKFKLAWNPA